MRKRFLLAVLLTFTAKAAPACDIPFLWTIQARDPCATLALIERKLPDLDHRRWLANWLVSNDAMPQPFAPLSVHDPRLAGVTFIERHDAWPCGNENGRAIYCAGAYWPDFALIEYSAAHVESLEALRHELAHFVYHRLQPQERDVGHGTLRDPLFRAPALVLDWFYGPLPDAHPYRPHLLPGAARTLMIFGPAGTERGCLFIAPPKEGQ